MSRKASNRTVASKKPTIIAETASWAAIEKPAGVVIHDVPGEKHAGHTLVDWLRKNIYEINKNFSQNNRRPGIVHRLDADTSGIVLVAKTPEALQALQELFRERMIQKTYQALVLGNVTSGGVMTGAIARKGTSTQHQIKRLSFSWEKRTPKSAETTYSPTRWYIDKQGRVYTLLELQPKTGRTHQLRVQLLDAEWPIIGDQTYQTKAGRDASKALNLERQFLHAASLRFSDPQSGKPVALTSQLPQDLKQVLSKLTEQP